ncbi:neuronal acetylcholine receptor subunit alpha-5 isoform X1 [Pocillopora verrucosa]|uniref:neuronal acetylcholine receptor subunit alpha-5 isoform X1 n=2 Tax=Pocillopora verrucosa TaxID=203993 RepID=UPI00334189CD
MRINVKYLLSTFYVIIISGIILSVNKSEEYKLRMDILKYKEPMVRPVENYSEAVNVSFYMDVLNLTDLDNKRQMLATNVWILQRWQNPFLEWKKEDYGGIDQILVSPTEIWVPDIVLYNNGDKQVRKAGHTELFKNWVAVNSTGGCSWGSMANLESSCSVEVSSFPFDEQECSLTFASASYGSNMLEIHSIRPLGKQDKSEHLDEDGEWEFKRMYVHISRKISQRHEDARLEYPRITYTLKIKRRPLYYIMLMIIPCVLCTLLVLASFAIPPENGERIGFCSTVMLSISVYLLIMADMLPEKSDTLPVLGVYYTITMFEIALALIGTIIVLRIYHSASEPPNCFKTLHKKRKAKKLKKIRVGGKWMMTKLLRGNAVTNNSNPVGGDAEPNITQVPVDTEPQETEVKGDGNGIELTEDDNQKIWRSIAVTCDRIFFWLFSIIFIGSTAYVIANRGNFAVLFDKNI